jgi:CO dehydrogenase nickel-insertion accessory protein CooC1
MSAVWLSRKNIIKERFMNILIYGNSASGKTILANLLAEDYKRQGHKVVVFDDDKPWTASRAEYDNSLKRSLKILTATLGKENRHTIVATQGLPEQIFGFYKTEERPRMYDFYYNTKRC